MASSKGKTKSGKSLGEPLKQEDIIQAVLIADSFNFRFSPITMSKPKALMPLVNCPMIEYPLEMLSLSGVQEVFVYCVSHSDQIRDYLKKTKWMKASSTMNVQIISSSDCRSLGDALRDLDGKSLIRNDFILLSADVVTNAHLVPILEKHKERRKADKGLVMTHIFRKGAPGHRTRTHEDECVLAVNPETGRVLHYQHSANHTRLSFPLEVFQEHGQVELRFDLVDTHISICSPTVLPLFSDNFDYQTHANFVRGILINEEILGNTIYFHQLEGSYGAHVSNIHMYDAISKDIINRWVYPIVPDTSSNAAIPRHVYLRHNVYLQPNVTLAKGSILESDTVIGQNTKIGEATFITRSVIGANCVIGEQNSIREAYMWNNVVIRDGCSIDTALIANDCVINENVKLGRGVVLGPGVVLAAGTVVPPNARLVSQSIKEEDGFESSGDENEDTAVPISKGSRAFVYHNKAAADEDESDTESLCEELWGLNITEREEDDEFLEEEEEEMRSEQDEDEVDNPNNMSPLPEDARLFYKEVVDSLQRGFEEKVKCENLVLEINSSKYAYNVSMREVNTLMTTAVLSLPETMSGKPKETMTSAAYFAQLKGIVAYFLPLFRNYIKSADSQMECIRAMEDYGVTHTAFAQSMGKILHIFYEKDILSEEVILDWFENPPADPSAEETVRIHVKPFIQWLQEAEEESDSDD